MRQRAKNSSEARAMWYRAHRVARIYVREHAKGFADCLKYGTSFVRVDIATGEAKHVPYADLVLPREPNP